jgi:hypothetical protein
MEYHNRLSLLQKLECSLGGWLKGFSISWKCALKFFGFVRPLSEFDGGYFAVQREKGPYNS